MLRWLTVCLLFFSIGISTFFPGIAAASPFRSGGKEMICALASLASYNDHVGELARAELANEGWEIERFNENYEGVDARFFLAKSQKTTDGSEAYLLAVTGTENKKDMAVDLNVDKVYFAGTTPETFEESLKKTDLRASDPMVHRGFQKYTQAAFFSKKDQGKTFGEYLADLLRENPQRKLYLTGHSLGGAAATMAGARLLSMGVNPDQLEVVSFGAPPIGNKAFTELFSEKLTLERVVIGGDPVESMLQSLRPDYAQFGDKVVWKKNNTTDKFKHAMVIYADAAMRQYYDELIQQKQPDDLYEQDHPGTKVYIAAPNFSLPEELQADAVYMKMGVQHLYSAQKGMQAVIGHESAGTNSFREIQENARANGCRYFIKTDFSLQLEKHKKHVFYASMQESLYDSNGTLQQVYFSSADTVDMTDLEAVMYTSLKARGDREAFFSRNI